MNSIMVGKRMGFSILAGALIAVLNLHCGVKGPPVAPDAVVPRAITDLRASGYDGNLVLIWSFPRKNTDRSKLEDLAGYRILQRVVEGSPEEMQKEELKNEIMEVLLGELGQEMKEVRKDLEENEYVIKKVTAKEDIEIELKAVKDELKRIKSELTEVKEGLQAVTGEEKKETGKETLEEKIGTKEEEYDVISEVNLLRPPEGQEPSRSGFFIDPVVEYGGKYEYRIVTFNSSGFESPVSNTLKVQWEAPPSPPSEVEGRAEDKFVELTWSPPETNLDGRILRKTEFQGYNVYRRTEKEEYGLFPLNPEPLIMTRFIDGGVENNQVYWYVVRAIRRSGEIVMEGKSSAEVMLSPQDQIAPSIPTGLRSVPRKKGIFLHWDKPSDPDLAGYLVYRRVKGERAFPRITALPVPEAEYLDTNVSPGKEYLYTVTAVDNAPEPNESQFSEVCEGSLLAPP